MKIASRLIMSLLAATGSVWSQNMIEGSNPGFEKVVPGRAGVPAVWNVYPGKGTLALDDKEPFSGTHSLRLESVDPMSPPQCTLDLFPVQPSTVYIVSFMARALPGPKGTARGMINILLRYHDENQKPLPIRGKEYVGRIQINSQNPSKEWLEYRGAVMAPPTARYAHLKVAPWRGTGKAWFDDFQVIADPAQKANARVPAGGKGKVKYFDFQKKDSPLWPGFQAVDETTAYSTATGYGWLASDGSKAPASRNGKSINGLVGKTNGSTRSPIRPDALSGDDLQTRNKGIQFVCDIPNGAYKVILAVEGYGRRDYPTPDESWAITAEGKEKLSFKMTQEKMLSDEHLYRWWDTQFDPSRDAWDTYIKPLDMVREFDVQVDDGRLDLGMDNTLIKYVIVSPAELLGAVRKELERVENGRRESFYTFVYKYREVADKNPEPPRSPFGYALFSRHYAETVNPLSKPTATELDPTSLRLSAAPGEYEPVTFTLFPQEAIAKVNVTATDLKSATGIIPAANVEVRLMRWRPIFSRETGHYHPFQDCVLPISKTDLKPGLNKRFWVTVKVPAKAKAGAYAGEITIAARGKATQKIRLTCNVLPIDLAPLPDSHSWSYYTIAPQVLGLSHEYRMQLALEMCEELKKHSMNSIQIPEPGINNMTSATEFDLDFTDFDLVMEAAIKAGLTGEKQLYTGSVASYTFRSKAKGEFNEQYNTGMKKYFQGIVDHCREKGWETPVIWAVDEPREKHLNPWNRDLVDTLKTTRLLSQVKALKVSVTPMADLQDGVDYLPMLKTLDVLQTHAWQRSERFIAQARKDKIPWWSFNSGTSRYSWGVQNYVLDAVGRWQWHYNFTSFVPYPNNPLAKRSVYSVVYPSPKGLVPAVNFEIAREGTDDYRYVLTLERELKSSTANKGVKAEAKALLAEIKSLAPWAGEGMSGTGVGGSGDFLFKSASGYDKLRARIAQMIVRL